MDDPRRFPKVLLLLFVLPWLALGIWQITQSYDTLAEDAWIHFRYARNLGEGHGLVSNPGGSHEEGYSSLASILVLAWGHALGLSLPSFERWIGILGSLGLILLLHRWLREVQVGSDATPWLLLASGLGILASSDLVLWTTAGLPTTEYAWLLLVLAWLLSRTLQDPTRGQGLLLGALAFVCLNARPEGVMYGPIVFVLTWLVQRIQGLRFRSWLTTFGPGILLYVLLTVALAFWKLSYFGDLPSNPSYVKLAVRPWLDPFAYFRRYFGEHGPLLPALYLLALLFAGWKTAGILRSKEPTPRALTALVLATFLASQIFYVWYVRGDYMAGFRFLVPAYPFLVGLLLLMGLELARWIPWFAGSPVRQGFLLLCFPVLPLFLSCFQPSAPDLPVSSGMIDTQNRSHYEAGRAEMAAALQDRDGPYALSEFGYIAWHLPYTGIDLMGLNQHEVARCFKRYPLTEAVTAARDFVLAQSPTVIATYGYWKDETGRIRCRPETAWFFRPYLRSPYFQNHYDTDFPGTPDDRIRLSLLRPDTPAVRRIDPQAGPAMDRLLHGFDVEKDKIWAGPIARVLLDSTSNDRRIVLRGYQPDPGLYPRGTQRIRVAIDGDTVGDRILLDRRLTQAGRFRWKIDLPADVLHRRRHLLSFFGEVKRTPAGSKDLRRLSWILESIELAR